MNTEKQPRSPEAAALGKLFREARGTKLQNEVAHALGIHENTYRQWEQGVTVPNVLALMDLARVLDTPVTRFLGLQVAESQPAYKVEEVQRAARCVRRGDYLYVPLIDVRANRQSLLDLGQVRAMVPFLGAYVASELGIQHDELVVVQMLGAMAEPDIHAGALMLIDLQDRSVQLEGHHLVTMDHAVFVKMLRRKPGRIMVSNNSADDAGAFEVDLHSPDATNFEVLGRCRWVGSALT